MDKQKRSPLIVALAALCFSGMSVLGGAQTRVDARSTVLTDDGFFIIPEQEEDGLISVGKYRIVDADLFPLTSAPGDIRGARRGQ